MRSPCSAAHSSTTDGRRRHSRPSTAYSGSIPSTLARSSIRAWRWRASGTSGAPSRPGTAWCRSSRRASSRRRRGAGRAPPVTCSISSPARGTDVPIEGPLRELSIHDVFQLLDLAQKTGVLRVTSELRQNGGTVYFDQGAVVAAEIQSNPHPLGSVLLRSGKVSESDLARARDMQASGNSRRLGEILIAVGAVPRKELERQVRAQVEEVTVELMGWSEGYFSFSESPLEHVPAQASLRIPTGALLMEAARRTDEWSRIESMVPHLGVVPRLVAPDGLEAAPMDLLPGEWQV